MFHAQMAQVQAVNVLRVVIDTGADLSVAQFAFSDAGGSHSGEFASQVCAASGTSQFRQLNIVTNDLAGHCINFRDIKQPILAHL